MVISILILGDFSLVSLTLLQQYSLSLLNFFLVLFILPFGLLFPFPAGISALFSQGPRRSAGLARVYALWNITSLINVVCFPSDSDALAVKESSITNEICTLNVRFLWTVMTYIYNMDQIIVYAL